MRKLTVALLGLAGLFGLTSLNAQDDAQKPLELFKALDKNSDGKLSKDEISDDRAKWFDRLVRIGDRDKNGALTSTEFQAALKPDAAPAPQPSNAGRPGNGRRQGGDPRQMLRQADRNQDGKITLEELPQQARDRMAPLFKRLGKDALTFDEITEAMSRGRRPSPEEMMERLDANKDGKLTLAEVPEDRRRFMAPMFQRIGKESVTLDDLKKAMASMQRGGNQRPQSQRPRPDSDRPAASANNSQSRRFAEENFARLDTNKDGKLTLDEAPERGKRIVQTILQRVGKGADDAISKEEFVKAALQGGGRPNDRPTSEPQRPSDRAPNTSLPLFVKALDNNKDGMLSKAELARASEVFSDLDFNGDGRLDVLELMGANAGSNRPQGRPNSQRAGGRPQRPGGAAQPNGSPQPGRGRVPQFAQILQRFDKNNDGKVSREEAPDKMKSNFEQIDTNKDKLIDATEFSQLFERFRNRPQ